MKKLYFLLFAFLVMGSSLSAQCVVDNNDTVVGITPPDSLFPVITRGVQLDNSYVAQVYVPMNVTVMGFQATVYWIDISSVTGFPNGITYSRNPTNDTIF